MNYSCLTRIVEDIAQVGWNGVLCGEKAQIQVKIHAPALHEPAHRRSPGPGPGGLSAGRASRFWGFIT
jgi:hypothetical protein